MQLIWTKLAETDLDKIEAYITHENNPVAAIDVILKMIDSAELVLTSYPNAGRQGKLKNTRELVIEGAPFILVYRINIQAQNIEVLRVLHDAQQWPTAD